MAHWKAGTETAHESETTQQKDYCNHYDTQWLISCISITWWKYNNLEYDGKHSFN